MLILAPPWARIRRNSVPSTSPLWARGRWCHCFRQAKTPLTRSPAPPGTRLSRPRCRPRFHTTSSASGFIRSPAGRCCWAPRSWLPTTSRCRSRRKSAGINSPSSRRSFATPATAQPPPWPRRSTAWTRGSLSSQHWARVSMARASAQPPSSLPTHWHPRLHGWPVAGAREMTRRRPAPTATCWSCTPK